MTTKLPYASSFTVSIADLDPIFGPDAPTLPDADPMPDAMQQNPFILHAMQILQDIHAGPNVLVDTNTMIYYDPTDGNRRIQPDVCVAFGVDAEAIYRRNGYLIWEVGKAPDFVLEIASQSTAVNDLGGKRDIYAALGVPEYWRFDASGGDMYGNALVGEFLQDGAYDSFPIDTQPDGIMSGFSPLLRLNLRWNEGALELQAPETGEILLDRRGLRLAMESAVQERDERIRELEARLAELGGANP